MKAILPLLLLVTTAFSQAPKPPVGVPADAQHFNGRWYKVVMEKVTWSRAKEKCAGMGGQLATVPDAETWAFLQTLTKAIIWLGATDEKAEAEWLWVDGTPVEFTAWMQGQPDNTGRAENYLAARDGKWNDVSNTDKTPAFICEWKPRVKP